MAVLSPRRVWAESWAADGDGKEFLRPYLYISEITIEFQILLLRTENKKKKRHILPVIWVVFLFFLIYSIKVYESIWKFYKSRTYRNEAVIIKSTACDYKRPCVWNRFTSCHVLHKARKPWKFSAFITSRRCRGSKLTFSTDCKFVLVFRPGIPKFI